MAINLAEKYSSKVDEAFTKKSLAMAFTNKDYDFVDVNVIKIYSIPTVAMADYTVTGSNRYGTPDELQNEIQTETLKKDRCFTFTIDMKSKQDTMGVMNAGKALARQMKEVVIPEVDTYVFGVMVSAAVANDSYATAAITSSNAYEKFLEGQEKLDNALVPEEGRIAGVTPAFYKNIKLDDSFMLATDIAMKIKVNGQVGEIDSVKIIKVPTTRLGTNVSFILAHPIATVMAQKLDTYKIHSNPPGISGDLVEGRIRYDAFTKNKKVDAIYVHATGAIS
jgi:hypothetical protein